ncbi:prolyl oligopeptidase family serine peptidase [bacterium]|nr:prolyl oligopeptidase family serine peptidase [bacterium]
MSATNSAAIRLLLAVACALVALGASADDHVFSVDHLLQIHQVYEAAISPDGETIAYTLNVPRDPYTAEDGPAWRELHVVGPDDREPRGFITGEVSVRSIDFTPDGEHVAFLSKRDGDEETALYAIPLAGGEARRILAHETAVRDYSFSPDGRHVAFLAREPEPEVREKLADKGFKAEIYEEQWRYVRVHVAPLDDHGLAGEASELDLEGSASMLHWSPDGAHLAVALAPTPSVDDGIMKRILHTVKPETGEVVGRIDTEGKLGGLAWSPDGSQIAFLAGQDRHDPANGRLMLAAATGGEPRDLRPDWLGDAEAVAWHDDDTLIYIAHEGLETMLVRQDVGGDPEVVVEPGGPALRSLDVSADGRHAALTADTPKHPREAYRWERWDDQVQRVSSSNPWLEDVELAKQEMIAYEARDGVSIDGLLIHPLGGVPSGGAPCVVMVHGGPEAHYSNGWITRYVTPGQILAARGFAVFYPNYRGSTGRGVDFAMAGQGDYAGAEFNDFVDGVDHLAAQGIVDRDRVGVTGGSYGGFASAWAATALSEHFKASVMFVGVSDQISKFGTTDIPNEMYLVHARSWPWEAWDFYRERSPIYHAEKHRTPLLILHGKNDPRVHPSQSLIMYRYLKTLDQAPVRLVWYPGEGHGNRRAAARLDYAHRLVRWMEHYVTGPGGEMPPVDLEPVVEKVMEKDEE